MRLSKTALIIVVSMIIFSILVANVTNLLSTDVVQNLKRETLNKNKIVPMSNAKKHLIWFMQISDLHISIFRDPERISELSEFCHYTIDAVKPAVVMASGDLTDARSSDNIGSKQFREEWEHYHKVLKDCNVEKKTVWLDIRGNHDNFNVLNTNSKEYYFANYSIQGPTHPRSYIHQVKQNDDLYSFIAVDACLEPGPRRPFNFVGMLEKPDISEIHKLIEQVKNSGSNYTIWFGHYPTSCILTAEGKGMRSMLGELDQSLAYLCGHLHTLGGLVPKMYTLQKEGFLELELGDWKDNRRLRVLAIDHGILSFVDVQHRHWPIILVTNPKHSLFLIPDKDNLDIIKYSSHIRILVFSLSPIEKVEVKIDDGKWKLCQHVEGPLYTLEWAPSDYHTDIHYIQVFAKDSDGREDIIKQPFSLDGSKTSYGLLSRFVLMTSVTVVCQIIFGIYVILSILPMCILRLMHILVKKEKMKKPSVKRGFCNSWVRKLWITATIDRFFWPLVLYPLYVLVGPWSIGHIIEDHIGVIFAWGIIIDGVILPGSITYAYGFVQLLLFHIPLTLILAHAIDQRFQYLVAKSSKATVWMTLGLHLPFITLITLHIVFAYFYWVDNGTLAFFLGITRTWSIIFAIILWKHALALPEKCTREPAKVWYVKRSPNTSHTDLSLNAL